MNGTSTLFAETNAKEQVHDGSKNVNLQAAWKTTRFEYSRLGLRIKPCLVTDLKSITLPK
jgi:hypothetical protein